MNRTRLFTSFEGRISRTTYWIATLVIFLVALIAAFVLGVAVVIAFGEDSGALSILTLVLQLVLLYPALALTIKRLHDRNRPDWWAAIIFVPTILSAVMAALGFEVTGPSPSVIAIIVNVVLVIASIWFVIELGILKGTEGPNRYGPDPQDAKA